MKYIGQTAVILTVTFLGEVLHAVIPLPVPAGIYGMVLMLLGLCTKIIPLSAVDEAGTFLTDIMPVMFIPAGVGLMASWGYLQPMLMPAALAVTVVTALVMSVSGLTAQGIMRGGRKK